MPGFFLMFWTYALYSKSGNLSYVGQTNDLQKRLDQHNGLYNFRSWTKRHRPWVLFHSEEYASRKEAIVRENELKSGTGREFLKIKLQEFKNLNPGS